MSRKTPANKIEPAKLKLMREMLEAGSTQREAAKAAGCAPSVAGAYAREWGLGKGSRKTRGVLSSKSESNIPSMERLVSGAEEISRRLLTMTDTDEIRATADAARAYKGLLDSLYKIYKLERGEPISHTKSEKQEEKHVVTTVRDPLRILRKFG